MFNNYIKIAIRNLYRYKKISIINVVGLAVGMACAILILIWIQDETSYDQFHKKSENIVLILRGDSQNITAVSSKMLGPAIKQELPQIINTTCVGDFSKIEPITLQYNEKSFEETWYLIDDQFFNIFSFDLKTGDPKTALKDPNSIILTEAMAKKYFGNDTPIGQTLTMFLFGQKMPLKVTAVLENLPHNSHIQGQIFIPIPFMEQLGINWNTWDDQSLRTYAQIEKCDFNILAQQITECEKRNSPGADLRTLHYALLPVTKIHLYGNSVKFLSSTSDIKYIYIFGIAAVIILLIASINYINLSTALSLKRDKEIGIKKVVGANRRSIIQQFFYETGILTVFALCFALFIVQLTLPVFNQVAGKILTIPFRSTQFLIGIFLITIFLSMLSGIYPALFLSSFQPVRLLKNKLNTGPKNSSVKKLLVIFQFSLSIILIISTMVVYRQLVFFQNSRLGYNEDNLICVKLKADISNNYDSFKNELLKNPDIISLTRSEPVSDHSMTRTTSVNWPLKNENKESLFWILHVDNDFAKTYQVDIQQGRFFSKEFSTDRTEAYIINESAVKEIGVESPLNKTMSVWGRNGKIVGVLKDFHFSSFHNKIEPIILQFPSKDQERGRYRLLTIRCRPGTLQSSLKEVQKTWHARFSDVPFNFYFLDDNLHTLYQEEERMGTLFQYVTLLAIFIACLGLYGLVLFSAEQKIKEIGIRKVLGAPIRNIILLISKEFIVLVISANLVAWPIAWFVMNRWLENFAYRTALTIWPFLLAGLSALLIALLTVSWQAVRAALANPVKTLRYE
ncbi:ABC transporter permease [candidate division KSB1 bacterium]|nr:ABC transporter permease [candidate division KSB1 bacterium]